MPSFSFSTSSPNSTHQQRLHWWIVSLATIILLALHWHSLGGLFTSDSLGLIRHCDTLYRQGQLWQWMGNGFLSGLSVESNYYRPLSNASICLDYYFYGVEPLGWRLSQLGLHAINGFLVYRIGAGLAGARPYAKAAAAVACALFWFSPATPEVSLWIAGRYNVTATLFTLLALWALLAQRFFLTAIAMALALCCKESSMILPALLASISWCRSELSNNELQNQAKPNTLARILNMTRELWPSALVGAAYLAWRWYLFGDPLSVYPNAEVALNDVGLHWFDRVLGLFYTLLPDWREHPLFLLIFAIGLIAAFSASAYRAWREGNGVLFALPAFWSLIAIVALLPHLQYLSDVGQGSRLLYNASAFLALALALAWSGNANTEASQANLETSPTTAVNRKPAFAFATAIALLLLIAQWPAQRAWSQVVHYQRSLIHELAQDLHSDDTSTWDLVLVPDHIGSALAARNAQGALVLPPFQQQALLTQRIPLVPQDLADWRMRLQEGVTWPSAQLQQSKQRWPQRLYCAEPEHGKLITLAMTPTDFQAGLQSRQAWLSLWQAALSNTACAGYVSDTPEQTARAL